MPVADSTESATSKLPVANSNLSPNRQLATSCPLPIQKYFLTSLIRQLLHIQDLTPIKTNTYVTPILPNTTPILIVPKPFSTRYLQFPIAITCNMPYSYQTQHILPYPFPHLYFSYPNPTLLPCLQFPIAITHRIPHPYPNQNIHYPYPTIYNPTPILIVPKPFSTPQLTIQIPVSNSVANSVADSKTQVRIGNWQLVAGCRFEKQLLFFLRCR